MSKTWGKIIFECKKKGSAITIQYNKLEPSIYKYRIGYVGCSGYYCSTLQHCIGWMRGNRLYTVSELEKIEEKITKEIY